MQNNLRTYYINFNKQLKTTLPTNRLTQPASSTRTIAFCCQCWSASGMVLSGVLVAKPLFDGTYLVVSAKWGSLVIVGSNFMKFEIIVIIHMSIFSTILVFSTAWPEDWSSTACKLFKVLSWSTAAEYTKTKELIKVLDSKTRKLELEHSVKKIRNYSWT